jgi:hypothetical protein
LPTVDEKMLDPPTWVMSNVTSEAVRPIVMRYHWFAVTVALILVQPRPDCHQRKPVCSLAPTALVVLVPLVYSMMG